MFDIETLTRAIMERMAKTPSQIMMDSSGSAPFREAWKTFLETPPHDASEFTAKFYALHRTLNRITPDKNKLAMNIKLAARCAAMGYITCAYVIAQHKTTTGGAPDVFTSSDVGGLAVSLIDLHEKVKTIMGMTRPHPSAPMDEKLYGPLCDFYTVMMVALNETRPIAGRNADTILQITKAIDDCFTVVITNNLALQIPGDLARGISGGMLGKAQPAAQTPFKLPVEAKRDEPEIAEPVLAPGIRPFRPAPASSGATVLTLDDAARKRIRERRLVEAARRVNPDDPGRPRKPDGSSTPNP